MYYTDESSSDGSPQIFRWDVDRNEFHMANIKNKESSSASFLFPIKGVQNQFICGLDQTVYVIEWDGCSSEAYRVEKLFSLEKNLKYQSISQAKTDPTGRLYIGTFSTRLCDPKQPSNSAFYSYKRNEGLQEVACGFKVSDGLAWSPNGNYFYCIDSCTFDIKEFKWDPRTGRLCK